MSYVQLEFSFSRSSCLSNILLVAVLSAHLVLRYFVNIWNYLRDFVIYYLMNRYIYECIYFLKYFLNHYYEQIYGVTLLK